MHIASRMARGSCLLGGRRHWRARTHHTTIQSAERPAPATQRGQGLGELRAAPALALETAQRPLLVLRSTARRSRHGTRMALDAGAHTDSTAQALSVRTRSDVAEGERGRGSVPPRLEHADGSIRVRSFSAGESRRATRLEVVRREKGSRRAVRHLFPTHTQCCTQKQTVRGSAEHTDTRARRRGGMDTVPRCTQSLFGEWERRERGEVQRRWSWQQHTPSDSECMD
jgi:hypothetical protein